MKTSEPKTTASSIQRKTENSQEPFFQKEGTGSFFSGLKDSSSPFFTPQNNTIQAKLTIGQPNDKYEQEADAVADQVVQRLAEPNSTEHTSRSGEVVTTPAIQLSSISQLQRKCEACEQEDKEIQEKPEEGRIQRKPIFESNGEDAIQKKSIANSISNTANQGNLIQRGPGDDLPVPEEHKIKWGFKFDPRNPLKSFSPIVGGFSLPSYKGVKSGLDTFRNKDDKGPTWPGLPQNVELSEEEWKQIYCRTLPTLCLPQTINNTNSFKSYSFGQPFGTSSLFGDSYKFRLLDPEAFKLKVDFLPQQRFGNWRYIDLEEAQPKEKIEGQVSPKCESCAQEDEHVMPKSVGSTTSASSNLQSTLNSTKGGGRPLGKDTQSSMESAFGTDFSQVRIHTNSTAIQMNKELNAQAFTHGSDIYFNSGKYDPSSSSGQHLLAHELTHTVQQGGGALKKIQKKDTGKVPFEVPLPPRPILSSRESDIYIYKYILNKFYRVPREQVIQKLERYYGKVDMTWSRGFSKFTEDLLKKYKDKGSKKFSISKEFLEENGIYISQNTDEDPFDWEELLKKRNLSLEEYQQLEHSLCQLVLELRKQLYPSSNETDCITVSYNEFPETDEVFQGSDLYWLKLEYNYLSNQLEQKYNQNEIELARNYFWNLIKNGVSFRFLSRVDNFNVYRLSTSIIWKSYDEKQDEIEKTVKKWKEYEEHLSSLVNDYENDPFLINGDDRLIEEFAQIKKDYNYLKYGLKTKLYESLIPSYEKFLLSNIEETQRSKEESSLIYEYKNSKHYDEDKTKEYVEKGLNNRSTLKAFELLSDDSETIFKLVQQLEKVKLEALEKLAEGDNWTLEIFKEGKVDWNYVYKHQPRLKNKIAKLQRKILDLRPSYHELYDQVTGELLEKSGDEHEESSSSWIKDVESLEKQYLSDPSMKGRLEELFLSKYLLFKYLEDFLNEVRPREVKFLCLSKHDWGCNGGWMYSTRDLSNWEVSSDNPFRRFVTRGLQLTNGSIIENAKQKKKSYLQVKKEFLAISRAYLLNEDPGYIERPGFFGALVESLGEATFWEEIRTDRDFIDAYISEIKSNGLQLTENQKSKEESSLSERLGDLTGKAIPEILKIVAVSLITEGMGTIPAISRAGFVLRQALTKRLGVAWGNRIYRIIISTTKETFTSVLLGQSWVSGATGGVVESLINPEKILSSFLRRRGLGSTISSIFSIEAGFKISLETLTEVIKGYSGELADEVYKQDFDIIEGFNRFFDRKYEKGVDDILLTLFITGTFTSAKNIFEIAVIGAKDDPNLNPEELQKIHSLRQGLELPNPVHTQLKELEDKLAELVGKEGQTEIFKVIGEREFVELVEFLDVEKIGILYNEGYLFEAVILYRNFKEMSSTYADFGKRRVFQIADSEIDPDFVSPQDLKFRSNLERMEKGLAPYNKNGEKIILHHIFQSDPGFIVELPHSQHDNLLHMWPGGKKTKPTEFQFDREGAFDDFRESYWKKRANDFYEV